MKRQLFKDLDDFCKNKKAIFCSNTSSLYIKDIASSVSEDRQKLFAGLHFFSPVPQMKLVEIVKSEKTDQNVINNLTKFIRAIGKTPVNCNDTPG